MCAALKRPRPHPPYLPVADTCTSVLPLFTVPSQGDFANGTREGTGTVIYPSGNRWVMTVRGMNVTRVPHVCPNVRLCAELMSSHAAP
jgi:hypothetical protein